MAENEKTEDELLEEMLAEEEAANSDPDADILGDTDTPAYGSEPGEDPGDDSPQLPTPEEEPVIPEAPAAVDPTAVETTASGKKFGWQQAPVRDTAPHEPCAHMGIVQARKQVPNQDPGHTWVCTCGTEFVVAINSSQKKILKEVV